MNKYQDKEHSVTAGHVAGIQRDVERKAQGNEVADCRPDAHRIAHGPCLFTWAREKKCAAQRKQVAQRVVKDERMGIPP